MECPLEWSFWRPVSTLLSFENTVVVLGMAYLVGTTAAVVVVGGGCGCCVGSMGGSVVVIGCCVVARTNASQDGGC